MDTLVYENEKNGRILYTNVARVVRLPEDVTEDIAADWTPEKANPYLKWIAGDFVESDKPNENTQFWTRDDLAKSQHTIKYAPLNMVHRTTQPVGFVHSTKSIEIDTAAEEEPKRIKIQALSAMWTHIFPFEGALVDSADEKGLLFYSMECRGTHLICGGDEGCGEKFEYFKADDHCDHLKERTSVRHIVSPTFRGSALIIPPIQPGWKEAKASVYQEAVLQEAARFAEATESFYEEARDGGAELTPGAWESLMSTIICLASQ